MEKTLNLIKNDPWLEPYAEAITGRHEYAMYKEAELTNGGKQTLSDFASGYLYFGLHRTDKVTFLAVFRISVVHLAGIDDNRLPGV